MTDRERFVPQTVSELTGELGERPWSSGESGEDFHAFSRLVTAMFHFRSYDREQKVVGAWKAASTDPSAAGAVADELRRLLDDANYTEITHEDLRETMTRESTVPLRLEVDLDDYEVLVIYRRDARCETIGVKTLWGLRTRERTITVEDRVIVLSKVESHESFRRRGVDPVERDLVPGQISLKQFQNVPRADIEMLLPSTKVRYRRIDTVLMGLPAVVSGIVVLATKLLPTLGLIAVLAGAWLGLNDDKPRIDQGALVVLFGGLITVGGFAVRQWTKLKNRRVKYLKTLSEILYFRTLSTGPGVLHTLLSAAEEQEIIEVLLAYRFLRDTPGCTVAELDSGVETWLRESCRRDIDFDVDNAIHNVRDLGLVHGDGDKRLVALALPDALVQLDEQWDGMFDYPRPSRSASLSA